MTEQIRTLEQNYIQGNDVEVEENQNTYLIFRLQDELYGSPLLSIKEVVKIADIKPVPYMTKYFKGVMNLRGQIVSVIDLRLKFGFEVSSENGNILVFEVENGLIGAIVDNVEEVMKIEDDSVDANPQLDTRVPMDFFIGVAKKKDQLINLVEISKCISADDMRVIKKQNVA